jgi:hypothetical protein
MTSHFTRCMLLIVYFMCPRRINTKKARPQRVFQRRLAACGTSVRSSTSRLYRPMSHRRVQSAKQRPCDVRRGVAGLQLDVSRPFPHASRGSFALSKSFDAKLLVCRVHFPSSPTMSLRSDDAETTRGAKLAACFVRVWSRLFKRLLACPAEQSPSTGIAQAEDVANTPRLAWQWS